MPDQPIDYSVDPDGTMLVAVAPSYVTNVVTGDATHQVVVTGRPAGDALTLTLPWSGETTAPIPAHPADPYAYFRWNKSDLAAGTYDLYANLFEGGTASNAIRYEVYDGATPLGTGDLNHGNPGANAAPVPDPALTQRSTGSGNGVPIKRYKVGRFTFPSGNLKVRVSCLPTLGHDMLVADNLWVVSTGGADVARIQPAIPPAQYATGALPYDNSPSGYQPLGQTPNMFTTSGTGIGTRYLLDPAEVRAALEALASVAPGDVEVSGDGSSQNPLRVHWAGALGGVARALPVAAPADGSVAVTDYAVGGILPRVTKNGVDVPLSRDYLYYPEISRGVPFAFFAWPQPLADCFKYAVPGHHDGNTLSGTWRTVYDGGPTYHPGYTPQVRRATGVGPSARFAYLPTPQGTYRVSVTHPVDAGYTTDAVYTVRDLDDNLLGTYHVDQTVAPSGALDGGVRWKVLGTFTLGRSANGAHMNGLVVTLTNATGAEVVADAVRFETVSLAQPTVTFDADDVVAVTAGRGWLTCSGGPAEAVTAASVTNLVGSAFVARDDSPAAMEIGYNIPVAYSLAPSIYLNRLRHNDGINAYPTQLGSTHATINLANSPPTLGGDLKSALPMLPGDHDILWKGASRAGFSSPVPGTVAHDAAREIFPGVDANGRHRRTARLDAGYFQYGVDAGFDIEATGGSSAPYPCDISDVWVVPKDTDVEAAPKWHPDFVARVTGLKTLRFLDPSASIEGNCIDFTDYTDAEARLSRNQIPNVLSLPMAGTTIADYAHSTADFPHDFDRTVGAAVAITFPSPHGLKTGRIFELQDYTGDKAVVSRADDGSTAEYQIASSHPLFAWVVSPTRVVTQIGNASGGVGRGGVQHMLNTITNAGGRFFMRWGSPTPVSEIAEICTFSGANLHWNCCLQASDACVASLAAYFAAHLPPGAILRWEAGNEPWNFSNSVCSYLRLRSKLFLGSNYDDWNTAYCEIAHNQHTVALAAWVAAGRDAADFRSAMGGQMLVSSYAANFAAYFTAKGWDPFTTYLVADYMNNAPSSAAPAHTPERSFRALVDGLSAGQQVTAFELHRLHGNYGGEVPAHRAQLVAGGGDAYSGTEIGMYEGGFDNLLLRSRDDDHPGPYFYPNFGYLSHAIQRHPRSFGINAMHCRIVEDSGCSFKNVFMLQGSDRSDGASWGDYRSAGELAYVPGDPAQDAIQAGQVDRLDLIRSVPGGAVAHYASLYGAEGTALAAGVATAGATTPTTASATATDATGGTAPYSYQWYRSASVGSTGSAVAGQTTRTLADSGLTPSTTYYYRLRYADAASAVVTGNQVTATTAAAPSAAAAVAIQNVPAFRHVRAG